MKFLLGVILLIFSFSAFANAGWPALLFSAMKFDAYRKFWFIVICALIIETFFIKYFLKFSWRKSLAAVGIGNLSSAAIGLFIPFILYPVDYLTYKTMFALDAFELGSLLTLIDISLTFILTVATEVIVIRYIYKLPWKQIIICFSLANVVTNALPWFVRYFS